MPEKKTSQEIIREMIPMALTPEEYDDLRDLLAKKERLETMLTTHERVEWLWGTIGVGLKWIAACAAALVAAKLLQSDLKDFLKSWIAK